MARLAALPASPAASARVTVATAVLRDRDASAAGGERPPSAPLAAAVAVAEVAAEAAVAGGGGGVAAAVAAPDAWTRVSDSEA